MIRRKYYWHIHHDQLVEKQECPIKKRISFITKTKPKHEVATRLRLLHVVKDQKIINAAYTEWEHACAAVMAEWENAVAAAYAEREKAVDAVDAVIAEREKAVNAADAEWEKAVAAVDAVTAEREKAVAALNAVMAEREKALDAADAERDKKLELLHLKECPGCPWNGVTIFPGKVEKC